MFERDYFVFSIASIARSFDLGKWWHRPAFPFPVGALILEGGKHDN